jgi:hypothetical protein
LSGMLFAMISSSVASRRIDNDPPMVSLKMTI